MEITHSYGAKADVNLLFAYGFSTGSRLSVLKVSLEASEDVARNCGGALPLDHGAPLAVNEERATCFEHMLGSEAFRRNLSGACSDLSRRLSKPRAMFGLGGISPEDALQQLAARRPSDSLDNLLQTAVRQELATLQRCSAIL